MIDILMTLLTLLAFGLQPLLPWRAAGLTAEGRRRWAPLALLALAAGAFAGLRLFALHPDAALAQGLSPRSGTRFAAALLVLLLGWMLSLLLAWIAGAKLETNGWRVLGLFGAFVLFVASLIAEVLRIGEGSAGPLAFVFALAFCRFLIALGGAEALAPGRQRLGPAAALALALYLFFLPRPVSAALFAQQKVLPFAAAALLFAGARWLPERLRRPALLAATFLAGVGLTLAANLSASLMPAAFDAVVRGRTNGRVELAQAQASTSVLETTNGRTCEVPVEAR